MGYVTDEGKYIQCDSWVNQNSRAYAKDLSVENNTELDLHPSSAIL